jgi:hypothetical protein
MSGPKSNCFAETDTGTPNGNRAVIFKVTVDTFAKCDKVLKMLALQFLLSKHFALISSAHFGRVSGDN